MPVGCGKGVFQKKNGISIQLDQFCSFYGFLVFFPKDIILDQYYGFLRFDNQFIPGKHISDDARSEWIRQQACWHN